MQETLRKAERGKIKSIFEDETSACVRTRPRKVIVPKGERPEVPANTTGYSSVRIAGFLDREGNIKIVFDPGYESEEVVETVKEVKEFIKQDGKQTLLIWDNAGGHVAEKTEKKLKKEGIELKQMPPHSPELNPVEPVWGMLKDFISGKIFESKEELREEIKEFFRSHDYQFDIDVEDMFKPNLVYFLPFLVSGKNCNFQYSLLSPPPELRGNYPFGRSLPPPFF